MEPVDCLGGRREKEGIRPQEKGWWIWKKPPQEKGQRAWHMSRTMTLMRGSSLMMNGLEIYGSDGSESG